MITQTFEDGKKVTPKYRGFEVVIEEQREFPNNIIQMPLRGSKTSAGYDLYSNEEVTIEAGQKHIFWTDIKTYMLDDEVLKIYVRSSIGIKKNLILCNQVGIIDSDYYSNPDNDGNLGVCLYNRSNIPQEIEAGDRIAQCIFEKFLVSDNCNTEEDRTGGIGSTD